jgi:H+-translocating NAD(P) transhydrogenase subunit alpha
VKIAIPKESGVGETRVTMIPSNIDQLVKLGAEIEIEAGLGEKIGISDQEYSNAGAKINNDHNALISNADIILKIQKPEDHDISLFKKGCIHISYLDPFNEKELINKLATAGTSTVSMEMIPRTTLAQKMDVLSSQANLAGYISIIVAAERSDKILPMMMTPAGTIAPARVFIIGAGVAGLQAIATAKRLGARVEAFDTREVVEEQVMSLGAKFVKVDLGETGQTKDGYAKALTEEQLQKQREAMAKHCAQADIVITTAQVFGRKAPVIVTKEMVANMKPGSIIVDMAVESGGNVEGSVRGEEVNVNGVKIIGLENLPGRVAVHASQMYSSNLYNFLAEFWDKENKTFNLALDHEIIKGCLITHNGEIVNETIKNLK